jgi:hypothetical protein
MKACEEFVACFCCGSLATRGGCGKEATGYTTHDAAVLFILSIELLVSQFNRWMLLCDAHLLTTKEVLEDAEG